MSILTTGLDVCRCEAQVNRWSISGGLADAGVDVEVDDSKATGEYANGVWLDPGTYSWGSCCTDAPPAWRQGGAILADAVRPSLGASARSEEDERRVLGRGRAGDTFHTHGQGRRAGDDTAEAACFGGVGGRCGGPRQHQHCDQKCVLRVHPASVWYATSVSRCHRCRCRSALARSHTQVWSPSEPVRLQLDVDAELATL